MFPLICVWINGLVNNRNAGDLRRQRFHYDVTVMKIQWRFSLIWVNFLESTKFVVREGAYPHPPLFYQLLFVSWCEFTGTTTFSKILCPGGDLEYSQNILSCVLLILFDISWWISWIPIHAVFLNVAKRQTDRLISKQTSKAEYSLHYLAESKEIGQ